MILGPNPEYGRLVEKWVERKKNVLVRVECY